MRKLIVLALSVFALVAASAPVVPSVSPDAGSLIIAGPHDGHEI